MGLYNFVNFEDGGSVLYRCCAAAYKTAVLLHYKRFAQHESAYIYAL